MDCQEPLELKARLVNQVTPGPLASRACKEQLATQEALVLWELLDSQDQQEVQEPLDKLEPLE